MSAYSVLRGFLFALLLLSAAGTAQAGILVTRSNTDFAARPATIAFGDATYTFSLFDPTPSAIAPSAVRTDGSALVASYGDPFFDPPRPAAYLSAGIIGEDEVATYLAYEAGTSIPFSNARIFIGLEFMLHDGVHYGFAELRRNMLLSYGYETIAGKKLVIGADPTDPPSAIPEPRPLLLLGSAITMLMLLQRRAVFRSRR